MRKEKILGLLSPAYLLLGIMGWGLHKWLFVSQVEDPVSGLLPSGTVPEILLWVLTGCAVAAAFALTRHTQVTEGSPVAGALSSAFLAAGILTLLLEPTKGPDALVLVYRIFCVLTAVSLLVSAVMQLLKKKPFFLLSAAPCVLSVLVLLEYYQFYSDVPQLMNYVLGLGAVLCLTLNAYHRMARAAGLPASAFSPVTGLLAVYFCAAAGSQEIFGSFFCASAVWVAAEMIRLRLTEE